jgi:hypothetical protein
MGLRCFGLLREHRAPAPSALEQGCHRYRFVVVGVLAHEVIAEHQGAMHRGDLLTGAGLADACNLQSFGVGGGVHRMGSNLRRVIRPGVSCSTLEQ